jgi:antitoxin component of RelBE/YafQ-DinJ toxin-antitoxin module
MSNKFITLKIERETAIKFRAFCRNLSKTQSDSLEIMLTFFERNRVSPYESLSPTVHTLEDLIKKRINGMIAILKDIEKNQTKPTAAMMQSLFKELDTNEKPLLVEKKKFEDPGSIRFREKYNNPNETNSY